MFIFSVPMYIISIMHAPILPFFLFKHQSKVTLLAIVYTMQLAIIGVHKHETTHPTNALFSYETYSTCSVHFGAHFIPQA